MSYSFTHKLVHLSSLFREDTALQYMAIIQRPTTGPSTDSCSRRGPRFDSPFNHLELGLLELATDYNVTHSVNNIYQVFL